jgi:hypothetical protein
MFEHFLNLTACIFFGENFHSYTVTRYGKHFGLEYTCLTTSSQNLRYDFITINELDRFFFNMFDFTRLSG